MKRMNLMVGLSFVTLLFCIGVQNASAISNSITISGFLTDSDNNPVTGTFAAEVDFYADQTTTTMIVAATTTTLTVSEGVFSFILGVPNQLLAMNQVWYSLSIDTDQNGLDPDDLFGERFQITSVPCALSTQPVNSFEPIPYVCSNGGTSSGNLFLTPFTTPSGGVEFTKIGIYLNGLGKVSFGLYDTSGTAVVRSPLIILSPNADTYEIPLSSVLQPSTMYYIGLGCNTNGLRYSSSSPPLIRAGGYGAIFDVVVDGMVPPSFNPASYVPWTDPLMNPYGIETNPEFLGFYMPTAISFIKD